MKILRFTYAAILAAVISLPVLAVSCEKEDSDSKIDLAFNINPVPAASSSQHITVSADKPWRLELQYRGNDKDWVSVSPSSGNPGNGDVVLKWSENITEESRTVIIIVVAGKNRTSVDFVQNGKIKDNIPDWLELPVMDENLEYYNHFFTMNGRRYRNYSFAWDKNALLAHWVAYPLCSDYIGSSGRTDKWEYDPTVPQSQQPRLYKGFGSGGYDRGHQIPSADRTCGYDANIQTFYFTNMTPQRSNFNQKIWANLEGKVRTWSNKADTLYVVTGCVIDGSTKEARDNDGMSVTVPTGYFKALLWYSKSSTTTSQTKGYRAAAFYLEHKDYSQTEIDTSMSMSIDDLEKKTRMDFFPNLKSKVGDYVADQVEAADPKEDTYWW